MNKDYISISKSLSYHLRHNLHNITETLSDGYVPVNVILRQSGLRGVNIDDVRYVVDNNEKKRFHLETQNGVLCIRAQQGHSHNAANVIDMSQVLQGIISRGIERIIPNNCSRIMKQFLSRALHFALDMNRSTK